MIDIDVTQQGVGFKKIGTETVYTTGAHRDARRGKGAFQWVPWDAFFLVSRIYEDGNIGRSTDGTGEDRNWEQGLPILGFVQSAINHLTAYLAGDRSEAHLPQAAWNVINAIQTSIWVHMGWRPASLNRLVSHQRTLRLDACVPALAPRNQLAQGKGYCKGGGDLSFLPPWWYNGV